MNTDYAFQRLVEQPHVVYPSWRRLGNHAEGEERYFAILVQPGVREGTIVSERTGHEWGEDDQRAAALVLYARPDGEQVVIRKYTTRATGWGDLPQFHVPEEFRVSITPEAGEAEPALEDQAEYYSDLVGSLYPTLTEAGETTETNDRRAMGEETADAPQGGAGR